MNNEEIIKEWKEKFDVWFKDFHPNNKKLLEQFILSKLNQREEEVRKEMVEWANDSAKKSGYPTRFSYIKINKE